LQSYKNIRTMTKLASYDKKYGKNDREITSHYRHSYVYRKNLNVRIGLLLAMAIMIAIKYLYNMMLHEDTFFSMFSLQYIASDAIKIIAVLVIYTIVCSIKFGKEYDDAQDRLEEYEEHLENFCRNEASAERNAYE